MTKINKMFTYISKLENTVTRMTNWLQTVGLCRDSFIFINICMYFKFDFEQLGEKYINKSKVIYLCGKSLLPLKIGGEFEIEIFGIIWGVY